MSTEEKVKRVTLSGEDKQTAARLYKEAYSALDGLAKLAAKTLGTTLSDKHQPMFMPKGHQSRKVQEDKIIEFRGIEIDCDEHVCYCIDYDGPHGPEIFLC
jgi:hypothetical protein